MTTNIPTQDRADIAHELQNIGDEFGCERLDGETTEAYGLRLLEYVAEMSSEMRAVESHVRDLISQEE